MTQLKDSFSNYIELTKYSSMLYTRCWYWGFLKGYFSRSNPDGFFGVVQKQAFFVDKIVYIMYCKFYEDFWKHKKTTTVRRKLSKYTDCSCSKIYLLKAESYVINVNKVSHGMLPGVYRSVKGSLLCQPLIIHSYDNYQRKINMNM